MNRTARNDAVASRILARVGGRSTSLDTLKACVDPFHDSEIDPQGWPDLTTSASVVQVYKASTTIVAPTNLPATATWDCHIWNAPILSQSGFNPNTPLLSSSATFPQGGTPSSNTGQATINNQGQAFNSPVGLSWCTFNTQAPPANFANILFGTTAPNPVVNGCLTVPLALSQGPTRVFASGIEVHNTTASLYKGGSVLSYRMPLDDNAYHTTVQMVPPNQTFPSAIEVLPVPAPPATLALALQLKGSRQWGAEQGVYQVHGLHTSHIPTNGSTFLVPMYYSTGGPDLDATQFMPQLSVSNVGTPTPIPVAGPRSSLWSEFDTSGAWFTGLTPQTTLTLNWNVYLERFPVPANTDLVLLAKMSPEYDVMGMELISAIMRTMPVATFVGDNSTGSWFSDIMETGANYLAPLLQAAPHPIMKGIGTAISAGNSMMKAWNSTPAAERNTINQKTRSFVKNVGKKPKNVQGAARQRQSKPRRAKVVVLPKTRPVRKQRQRRGPITGTPAGKRWQKAKINPGYRQNVSTWITPSKGERVYNLDEVD